jgi:hypothetical protein
MVFLNIEDELEYVRRAKSLGLWLMAKYLKNELPQVPAGFKFRGPFWRWLRPRVRVTTRPNTWLFYSLLQSKRAAAPLSPSVILDAYRKHSMSMEILDPIDSETEELVMKQLTPVLGQIGRRLNKLYRSRHSQVVSEETRYAPSERACFETSRSDGGQKAAVVDSVIGFGGCPSIEDRYTSAIRCECESELRSMGFHHVVVRKGRTVYNSTVETRWSPDLEAEARETVRNLALIHDTPKRLDAMIYGILEPLKVRVISKGNAVPYYVAKELQKSLHTALRGMDCFRLIGRPLCPTDLMDISKPYPGDEDDTGTREWLSVDYSSATDWLSASLSRRILETLIQDLDGPQHLWKNVLAPHTCHYPPVSMGKYKVRLPPVIQQNGQLMGSPLSFPILCLANLGLYLAVHADKKASLRDKLSRVLVNGDDMIYVGTEDDWNRHIELGNKVGLVMTPGKAYRHRVFANANSTCFHHDLRKPDSTPFQIDFLNTGLFFGQNKVLGQVNLDEKLEEDPLYDERDIRTFRTPVIGALIKGCRNRWQCRTVFKLYLRRHSDEVRAECGWRGLFVKTSFGGMGLDPIPGVRFRVTRIQRMVAHRRLSELGDEAVLTFGGPTPGPVLGRTEPPAKFILDGSLPASIQVPGPRVNRHRRRTFRMLPASVIVNSALVPCRFGRNRNAQPGTKSM